MMWKYLFCTFIIWDIRRQHYIHKLYPQNISATRYSTMFRSWYQRSLLLKLEFDIQLGFASSLKYAGKSVQNTKVSYTNLLNDTTWLEAYYLIFYSRQHFASTRPSPRIRCINLTFCLWCVRDCLGLVFVYITVCIANIFHAPADW